MCVGCQKKGLDNKKQNQGCNHLYPELNQFSLQLIDVLDKKFSTEVNEANNLIRSWIIELDERCPSTDDLELIRKFVKDEYTKYTKK